MINPDALRSQSARAFVQDPLRFERDLPIENMRGLSLASLRDGGLGYACEMSKHTVHLEVSSQSRLTKLL
jgi:hypothetical protein